MYLKFKKWCHNSPEEDFLKLRESAEESENGITDSDTT